MRRILPVFLVVFAATGGHASGASLQVDNNPISLFANAGSTTKVSDTTNVTASSGTLSFTATAATTSGGNWLLVSRAGTLTTPQTLTITGNSSNPPAGNYPGTVTLACLPVSAWASVVVNVSFNVSGIVLT